MGFSVKVHPQFSEGITLLPALSSDRQIDSTTICPLSPGCQDGVSGFSKRTALL